MVGYPATTYTVAGGVLGLFALSTTPVLAPIAILLAVVRLSTLTFIRRQSGHWKAILQASVIAIASGAAHLTASLTALSTPHVALVVISTIFLATSLFAVGLVYLGCALTRTRAASSTWHQLTLFPALWASAWGFVSEVSPVGQLVTWSPVLGLGPYLWTRSVLGQWGIDWITAAWAVVISETAGDWLVGRADDDTEPFLTDAAPLLGDHVDAPTYHTDGPPRTKTRVISRSSSVTVLTGALLALMLPTYLYPATPLPVISTSTTPLDVSCVLPNPRTSGHGTGNPTLEDFIAETKVLQARSTVLLWPESAVRFDSPEAREAAFERIQKALNAKKFVGVSFEEYFPSEHQGEAGIRRNGFAMIDSSGPPLLEYYKRNLVPSKTILLVRICVFYLHKYTTVAESFSLTPGHESPSVVTVNLTAPHGYKKPEWSPEPPFTRPLPVAASICLDFASTSSFTSLKTRPALILAPGKTWEPTVGLAMWEQAKARAAETGATILWCDGGSGGLSGIASGRYSEIVQAGSGSWVKSIGVEYPFPERHTWYLWGGQYTAFIAVWAIVGGGSLVQVIGDRVALRALPNGVRQVIQTLRNRGRAAQPAVGNLLD